MSKNKLTGEKVLNNMQDQGLLKHVSEKNKNRFKQAIDGLQQTDIDYSSYIEKFLTYYKQIYNRECFTKGTKPDQCIDSIFMDCVAGDKYKQHPIHLLSIQDDSQKLLKAIFNYQSKIYLVAVYALLCNPIDEYPINSNSIAISDIREEILEKLESSSIPYPFSVMKNLFSVTEINAGLASYLVKVYQKHYPQQDIDFENWENVDSATKYQVIDNLQTIFDAEFPPKSTKRFDFSDTIIDDVWNGMTTLTIKDKESYKDVQQQLNELFRVDMFGNVICKISNNQQVGYNVDHYWPVSRGGKSDKANCRLIHTKANAIKSDNIEQFIDWGEPFYSESRFFSDLAKYNLYAIIGLPDETFLRKATSDNIKSMTDIFNCVVLKKPKPDPSEDTKQNKTK